MTVLFAGVLGLIQGLTEFLPVSSSGHLVLIQELFGEGAVGESMAFDVLLHLGTLVSVWFCYAGELWILLKECFYAGRDVLRAKPLHNGTESRKLLFLLITATLPMALAPFLQEYLESFFQSPAAVGCMLLVTSLLLYLADTFPKGEKTAQGARMRDALTVGIFQLCALLPGLSRSGTTIFAARLRRFSPEFAVKFSFLLSVPVIAAANLFSFREAFAEGFDRALLLPYAVGVACAAVSGIAAVKFVKLLSRKSGFRGFSLYTAIVGSAVLLYSVVF